MSTYENRIEALEQRVADIELERLYEKRKTVETTSSEQAYDIKQVNHRLTMLLGIISGQEHAIRTLQGDMDLRFDTVDARLNTMDARLNKIETTMATKDDLAALESRVLSAFQQLLTVMDQRLPPQEK